ncbi:MAG: DNA-3-methyladenine glycosylase I [Mycobacteriaceae bacterium]
MSDLAGVVAGDDGLARCPWGDAPSVYRRYHDEEWGHPVHGRNPLYERLCLEAFQAGLSWITVLRKREAFRRAFAGFDPELVAAFGDDDVQRLLADVAIVRNRAKILAVISNSRAVLEIDDLDGLLWSFAPPATRTRPRCVAEVPAVTPASVAMAKALKSRGLRFIGPTTAYALMQATGIVDDHLTECWRAARGAVGTGVPPGLPTVA